MNSSTFATQFRNFDNAIRADSGKGFESFQSGKPAEWEAYKGWLREEARARLELDSWKASQIGRGKILERVISAIEVFKNKDLRNNLVRWEGRYGPESKSHRAILAARDDDEARRGLEETLFELLKGKGDEGTLFEALRDQIGNRYDVIAYLFFLKDWEQYMPVSPQVFSEAFRLLGVDSHPARK